MRAVAQTLANEARENYGGVDVISVGPAVSALTSFWQRYSVMTISRARRTGLCWSDQTLATVYRIALIIALEEFFA